MKAFLTLLMALAVSLAVAIAAEKGPKAPEYPGQPSINAALRDLEKAKDIIDTNKADALVFLKKAHGSMESSIKDKGNFRSSAIRWIRQAIKHLEESDAPKALREIDEAIADVHKAGKIGSK